MNSQSIVGMQPDVELHMPNGSLDRRRLQNRVAQRKYRQKRNLARQVGSGHASNLSDKTGSLLQPPLRRPLGANVSPTDTGSSQEIPGATRWESGPGDGSIPASFQIPSNSDASWDTTVPIPIDENHLLSQSSSDFSSRSIVPANNRTSLSSGHTKPPSRLDQSDASNLPIYTISPTPWLDNQLKRQPEPEVPEEGWLRPLHIAAQKGNLRILKILARHSPDINDSDSHGQTPLIHAVQGGYSEAVSILLANGAHLDSVDRERRSALHWAVLHRRRDVLEVLLDYYAQDREAYGSFVNAYDDAGWTPLHMAIYWEFEAGVVLLIQYGADVTTKAAHCPYAEVRQKATEEASSLGSSTKQTI